jgi:type I restriction enzyme R subunit
MERLSKKYSNDLKVIRAAIKKNVFIIDECHRTVNGEGMATIDRLFQNSVKLGLTGTPIFEENMDKTIGKTTKDIFENQCHTYMAINAISDKNILEFKIEYFSNLDKKNYDETTELKRKDEVVLQILKRYELLTKNREFNSMLTVNSKDDAIKYMELFKKTDIKTATIFTSDEQSDVQKGHLKRIIEEYNEVYGATCNIGDQKEYKKDLTNRMKNKEIDLLIVVQMFLTGFDSRLTNTLFVDKRLEYHGLLQAFSRTNRLSTKGNKDFGNIVVFSDIEKNIEDSLTLFSNGNSSDFKAKTYEESSKRLKGLIEELKREFPVASSIENETSEKRKREFIKKVSSVLSHIERVKSYKEFNQSDFDISDSETSEFRSKLQNLFSEAKRNKDKTEDFIKVEDFTSSLLKVDIISVDYLTDLIKGISQTSLESEVKKVEDLINNSDHLIKNRLLALLNSRVEGLEIDPKEEFKKDIENRKNKIFKLGYFIDVSCFEDFIDKVYKDFVLIESSDKFKNIDSFLKGCKSDLTFSEKIEIKNTFIEEVKSFIEFKDSISSS